MLFFILSANANRSAHWTSAWYNDLPADPMAAIEEIADEVRGKCMLQGRQYLSMWGFDLKTPMKEKCVKLHDLFDEKLRRVLMAHFAVGYMKGFRGRDQSAESVAAEEAELIAADPEAATLINTARGFGLRCGSADASDS